MSGAPVLLTHPSSLRHETGAHPPHPEQPARIAAIERELDSRGYLGFARVSSPPAEHEVLRAVHPERHIELIKRAAAGGGAQIDADTVVSPGSFEAGLHAAGGAVALVDRLMDGSASTGFSIHRPPGHHAEAARAMGFCLFNSVAVAARHAVDGLGLERVMVVDWDVHHGNGTNDIFHEESRVLFCSVHQSPLYPGTGPAGDVGSGPGRGFTVNVPVPPGSGDETFCSAVEHVFAALARAWEPQLLLVSAGYDAHHEDPLADCLVTDAGYATMARSVRRAGQRLGAPVGAVLEGGYALGGLARGVAVTMEALAGGGGPAEGEAVLPVADVSARALARLGEFWPGLGG
ncbi:MAG TPA: histone deacetylase [Solirubrobacteraceae bacterium]|nr:histone deacetylase [Solirubrobacteraceae bacterium]